MSNPLISIIIPTFNRAHLIGETLDSIIVQTYSNWECIVVDDGSTDNTDEVMAGYLDKDPRVKYFKRPENHRSGGNGARNYGYLQSKGEFVNWFDSDDLMHPEKLEKQVRALQDSEYNFAVCQTLVFEGQKGNILGLRHKKITSKNPLEDFIMHKIKFLTQAPFFRKSFLEQYNLMFDEELKAAQEWEFICRVLYFSSDYYTEDTPMVYIRRHENSISYGKNKNDKHWNYLRARTKIFHFLYNKKYIFKNDELYQFFKNYFIEGNLKAMYYKPEKILNQYNESLSHFHNPIQRIKTSIYLCLIARTGRGHKYKHKFIK